MRSYKNLEPETERERERERERETDRPSQPCSISGLLTKFSHVLGGVMNDILGRPTA